MDFSAAADAGKHAWVSVLERSSDGSLRLVDVCSVAELPGGAVERDIALRALRDFLCSLGPAAVGFDFPAGLPESLLPGVSSWIDFARNFGEDQKTAGCTRDVLLIRAGGRELRRQTDIETRTPMSPYNLRLYRQMFFGICGILRPLVMEGRAYVLPMQAAHPGGVWLLETCPASVLKRVGLYQPYKGRTEQHRAQRQTILEWQLQDARLAPLRRAHRQRLLEDDDGDALDSLIAAAAAARASADERLLFPPGERYRLEGYVYC